MEIQYICRIAEISDKDISIELLKILQDGCCQYEDKKLNEDLYNPEDLMFDERFEGLFPNSVQDELKTISNLCEDNNCYYFRIVY